MADVILTLVEMTVWVLDETVFAVVCMVEGLIAVLTFLPSVVINLYFLMELIIVGVINSIKLILAFLWFAVSFLIHMPFNLWNFLNSVTSAIKVCTVWSLQTFSYIFSRLYIGSFHIYDVFKQFILYIIDISQRYSYVIITKLSDGLIEYLTYITSNITGLFLSLGNRLQQLLQWSLAVVWRSWETIAEVLLPTFFKPLRFVWNLLQSCFTKIYSVDQFFSSFDSSPKFTKTPDLSSRQSPTYGASWLTRFSQLMLAFSLIIFITVIVVILYHMRYKVQAAFANLLRLLARRTSQLLQNGHGGDVRRNNERTHLPLEGHRQELDEDAESDEDEEPDDFDHTVAAANSQLPGSSLRSGSAKKEMRHNQPSTSRGFTINYERLLQDERDKQLCVICQDNVKDTLIFPCKHLCVCNDCVEQITNSVLLDSRRCPLCRTKISSYLDVYT